MKFFRHWGRLPAACLADECVGHGNTSEVLAYGYIKIVPIIIMITERNVAWEAATHTHTGWTGWPICWIPWTYSIVMESRARVYQIGLSTLAAAMQWTRDGNLTKGEHTNWIRVFISYVALLFCRYIVVKGKEKNAFKPSSVDGLSGVSHKWEHRQKTTHTSYARGCY